MPKSARETYLLKTYGITLKQYFSLFKKQGSGCAICGKPQEKSGKSLAVDHNHKTGEIRGILCSYCNHKLVGRHRNPDLLRRVADYISQGTGWFVPKRKKRRSRKTRRRR